jgi:hypothetical protein
VCAPARCDSRLNGGSDVTALRGPCAHPSYACGITAPPTGTICVPVSSLSIFFHWFRDLCFLVSPLLPYLVFALVLPNMYLAVADALFGMAIFDLRLPLPLFAPLAYPTGWRPINLALKSNSSTYLLGASHRMLGQEGQT